MIKNKKVILLIEFVLSAIIIKLAIHLFSIPNHSVYTVIAVGIVMFLLHYRQEKKEVIAQKSTQIISCVYSLAIAVVLTLQSKITFQGDVGYTASQNTFAQFEGGDILKLAVIFVLVYVIVTSIVIWFKTSRFTIIRKKEEQKQLTRKEFWTQWSIATILVAIPFFLYLITYAPGAVLGDSLASITQGLGEAPFYNHHPIVYSMFVGIFMRIGQALGSYNIGVMLYSCTQLILLAGMIGYFLVWLRKYQVKSEIILLTYLFFVANTIFSAYSIIMWKDPLFCGFIFLMCLFLFDIVKEQGRPLKKATGILKFTLLSLLIAFFRNNGFLIVIGIDLILVFLYRKEFIPIHVVNGITIVLILVIQGPIYTKLNMNAPLAESMGVPLQQIARTITEEGKITDEQKQFLNQILPLDKWSKNYQPCIVDSIKWDPEFNNEFLAENKGKFLTTWASMLPSNFTEYVKSYLMQTYGFWSLETKNEFGFVDTYIIENQYEIERKDLVKTATGFSLENTFTTPDFLGSGTLFWMMVLSGVLVYMNRKKQYLLVLLPCFISWISIMIATPVAFSLRYVFMLAFALPLIVYLPWLSKEET